MSKSSTLQIAAHKSVTDDWTADEIDLIRETVANNATNEELKLFLYTAKARGLNPLLKQIYFIKRKQKRGDRWVDVGVIQTGVDGFRLIANRTGQLRGIERGIRRDELGKLYAWARVWRKDWEHPAFEEVSFDEYRAETALWSRMPEQMLKKCAEVAALRMAFPEDLSGLYSHEEMEQADVKVEQTARPEPISEPVVSETSVRETEQYRETQKAMKECLNTIMQYQTDYALSKEDIQWITGLETFKGVDLQALEKATQDVVDHCLATTRKKSTRKKEKDKVDNSKIEHNTSNAPV